MGLLRQIPLLMWKNWILQKRSFCMTFFELILPVAIVFILISLRDKITTKVFLAPTIYPQVPIISQNTLLNQAVTANSLHFVYTPPNKMIEAIMKDVVDELEMLYGAGYVLLSGLSSSIEVMKYFASHPKNLSYAFIFKNIQESTDRLPNRVEVIIQPNCWTSFHTEVSYPKMQTRGPRIETIAPYEVSGFLYIQQKVAEALMKVWNPEFDMFSRRIMIVLQRMPYPPFTSDEMTTVLKTALSLLILLSFILCVIQTTKHIVYEKERGLKESMKLMGLNTAAHWVSWFLTTFIKLTITVSVFVVLLTCSVAKNGPVLVKSDVVLFAIFLLLYALALTSFSFMVSVFIQRANISAPVVSIVYIMLYCMDFKNDFYLNLSTSGKFVACLSFNLAMAFGFSFICLREGSEEGMQWSNFRKPVRLHDHFTFSDTMSMLAVDSILYLVVTWYVSNIYPGMYGLPRPWYFPVTKHYWLNSVIHAQDKHTDDSLHSRSIHFELVPSEMEVGIKIRNLRKVFGKVIAVKSVTLTMYEGQITALLGHNGAGKTTTLSILTGFIPPTSGTAIVNGYDIRTDIAAVRRSLGLCPQHNILFDTLTVEEHLRFFAQLKGVPKAEVDEEVKTIIKDIGLAVKHNVCSSKLSGGQKRKLGIGIALIGSTKIVILDEPTSGVDPSSRRHTWDLLQRNKEGRTQIITTHFMDEADVLGDRIAIMVEGAVKCCGTSYFLKQLYGKGYHLVIVKKPDCNIEKVTKVVQSYVSTSALESVINTEITYLLPNNESHMFAELFSKIEKKKEKLGIINFGTTATSLEEVFLKVAEPGETIRNTIKDYDYNEGYVKKTGFSLQRYRLHALLVKKAYLSWRNRKITVTQIVVPVFCTLVALWFEYENVQFKNENLRKLDLSVFGNTIVPYSEDSTSYLGNQITKSYAQQLTGKLTPEKVESFEGFFLSKYKEIGINEFDQKYIIGAEFSHKYDKMVAKGFYNGQTFQGPAVSMSYLLNAIVKFASPGKEISFLIKPLHVNEDNAFLVLSGTAASNGFVISFLIAYGMAFLTATFVYSLISERSVGSKQLQTISGVGPFVYWLSSLIWDYANYMLVVLCMMMTFLVYGTKAFVGDERSGILLLIFVCYGWSVLPFMYLIQFCFQTPVTGIAVTVVFNVLSGLVSALVVHVFTMLPLTKETGKDLDKLFVIFLPHHALSRALEHMYINYMNLDARRILYHDSQTCGFGPDDACREISKAELKKLVFYQKHFMAWSDPGVGRKLVFMAVQGFIFFIFILFLEYKIPERLLYWLQHHTNTRTKHQKDDDFDSLEDSDVAQERNRIISTSKNKLNDTLVIKKLCKRYGKITAVDGISVGIAKKECFGLLGQNGAGKTTMFKMLSGSIMMTSGRAFLNKMDIHSVFEKIGYCPQFDALIDQMTGRETLTFYARLRGIPYAHINRVVDSMLDMMMLTKYADKSVSTYSGGNKRKVSTCIALLGDPLLILLDEPTTGMDPKARRYLWDVLSKVRDSGKTLVLTTHSMEECDALCTRMAIMVNGKFVCLGSPQHLKSKFAQGYTLIAKLMDKVSGEASFSKPLIDYVQNKFKNAEIFETHVGYVHLQIPSANVSLAEIFETMEHAKMYLNVTDYSVHQTTLEQVFLSFVGSQAVQEINYKPIWQRAVPCLV